MSLINIHQQVTFYYLKEIQQFCEKQNDFVLPLQKLYQERNAVLETITKREDNLHSKQGCSGAEQDTHKKDLPKMAGRFVLHNEDKRSNAFKNLNCEKELKLAVITLPADGEFFLNDFSMKKGKAKHNTHQSLQRILNNLKDSIQQNRHNFYIPKEIKRRLFGQNFSNGQLEALFLKAVKKEMGEVPLEDLQNIEVSPEKRNAILFQFVKFELTHEILKLANPKKTNFPCKEGIDKGAIHSLWYYLNLRYEEGKPMTEAEFIKYLDASAIVVKYRPNHTKNIIWNALKHRITADSDFNDAHPWARQWMISNTPDDVVLESDWQSSYEQKNRLKFR